MISALHFPFCFCFIFIAPPVASFLSFPFCSWSLSPQHPAMPCYSAIPYAHRIGFSAFSRYFLFSGVHGSFIYNRFTSPPIRCPVQYALLCLTRLTEAPITPPLPHTETTRNTSPPGTYLSTQRYSVCSTQSSIYFLTKSRIRFICIFFGQLAVFIRSIFLSIRYKYIYIYQQYPSVYISMWHFFLLAF